MSLKDFFKKRLGRESIDDYLVDDFRRQADYTRIDNERRYQEERDRRDLQYRLDRMRYDDEQRRRDDEYRRFDDFRRDDWRYDDYY